MPRKMKIEASEIAELDRQHLAGEIGVNEAGHQAGVDFDDPDIWLHICLTLKLLESDLP